MNVCGTLNVQLRYMCTGYSPTPVSPEMCVAHVLFLEFMIPSLHCRSPLPHGADQGPDSSGASGGTVVHARATPGPV